MNRLYTEVREALGPLTAQQQSQLASYCELAGGWDGFEAETSVQFALAV